MTSERLYGILRFITSLDQSLGLQTKLGAVRDALNNLTNQPAQPNFQNSLASANEALTKAVSQLPSSITPSLRVALVAMGGEDFFDEAIGSKVLTTIQKNAMTPSVARDFVQDLVGKRAAFLDTVRTAKQALEQLRVSDTALEPGTADVSFLIPRQIFHNQLGDFAKELKFISALLQDYSEALTGKAEPVILEQLSSSVPTVALEADLTVLSVLGGVIITFLKAWEKIDKIRRLRRDMTEIGVTGPPVDYLTEQITTTVDTVVEESTKLVISKYTGKDTRRNELENAIHRDTQRLFGQIERGLTVEFRSEQKSDAAPETQKQLQEISEAAKALKYPTASPEPLLLSAGNVLEDGSEELRVVSQSKRTTTHKTTTITTKKASSDPSKSEA